MSETLTVLPTTSDRWRPSRAGLVSLWRYWDETFTFHRGRLLLRGPNGSGKSMALELLLPFLLDADASPGRLSSAAKSRGGLYDRAMTGTDEASRTGFAWVEFRRGDDTFTVGARIRASAATRKADVDYFTTTLKLGRDLELLDANRTPLSRKALKEAIGETGRVHDSADEHRAAVREVLFPGFSPDRYASVIGALLALRKERLSQNLDLAKLSEVLSEALPPLDDHDIAVVAEGFERLDRRRAELAALEDELAEVRQLAARQRAYARAVVVGAAAEVRAAETRRDDVTRAERQAKLALEEVEAESAGGADERRRLADRIGDIAIEIEALKDSEAYRQGAALADLRVQAQRLRRQAQRAGDMVEVQNRLSKAAAEDLEDAVRHQRTAIANREPARRDVDAAAAQLGAEALVTEAASADEPDEAERLVHAWVEAHRARVQEVRDALDAHAQATAARGHAENRVADDEATVAARGTARHAALVAESAAVDAFRQGVEEWCRGCDTIGSARLAAALPPVADEPSLVTEALRVLSADLRSEDAVARRDLDHHRQRAGADKAALLEERSRWAEGGLVEPDGPPWRSPRHGLPGAPLWRLVDVVPGVASSAVDGLEAALTGAGLLDAWVEPDGTVHLAEDRADVVLGRRPMAGRTLADLLVPAVGDEVPIADEVVAEVLASVAVTSAVVSAGSGDDAGVVIGTDGTYRVGPAVGRGPQRPAMLLGAVARERHRLERLAAVDADIASVDAKLAELDRQETALDRRWAAVASELQAVPSGSVVEDARRASAHAAARLAEAEAHLDAARIALRETEGRVREALRTLTTRAAGHSLPTEAGRLAEVEAGLTRLTKAGATWARRRREVTQAERRQARATARAAEIEGAWARAGEDHAEVEREASAVEGRVSALESSIGAEYGELLGRVASLEEERAGAQRRERELGDKVPELERRVGKLGNELAAAEQARVEAEENRARTHHRFVAVLAALGVDAGMEAPGSLDSASATLAAARAIATDHDRIETGRQARERLSELVRERVHTAQAALGGRVEVNRELADEGWWVLRTIVGGIRRGAAELAAALAATLEEGRAELAVEEERLFEQTLAGSVRRALADRIRLANSLVDAINAQLAAVRTMAGEVQVRLRWEVDPDQPEAVKAARSLLLQDPAGLSDGQRESLQAFVRARVDQARAELEAHAPWEARLRETLDYRAWHRFTLLLAHRDWDGFKPATPRRLQTLSTGERSIALHLPMIASVAAHYAGDDGRRSSCPRLILLDELFAGVDAANRAQLFGTFSAWDLDAVFTSDHEWCQYATLDGIAIHHLHPPTGDEPVTSTRFTWDGHRRHGEPSAA